MCTDACTDACTDMCMAMCTNVCVGCEQILCTTVYNGLYIAIFRSNGLCSALTMPKWDNLAMTAPNASLTWQLQCSSTFKYASLQCPNGSELAKHCDVLQHLEITSSCQAYSESVSLVIKALALVMEALAACPSLGCSLGSCHQASPGSCHQYNHWHLIE